MRKILLIYLASLIQSSSMELVEDGEEPTFEKINFQSRCTRRFTPGVCGQPVAVVWTFVFQIQNCTERLGCPTATRTNRFNNYRRCMRHCRPIAELYSHALAGGRNASDGRAAVRREGTNLEYLERLDNLDPGPEYDEAFGDLPLVNPLEERESDSDLGENESLPLDIDNEGSDHVPNPFDLFHDAFGSN